MSRAVVSQLIEIALYFNAVILAIQAISCVRCRSDTDVVEGQCELDPPVPTLCVGPETSCMTGQEFNAAGGHVRFIRDCSSMDQRDEECRILNYTMNTAVKICYTICIEYGCNSANIHFRSPLLVLLLPIFTSVIGLAQRCR